MFHDSVPSCPLHRLLLHHLLQLGRIACGDLRGMDPLYHKSSKRRFFTRYLEPVEPEFEFAFPVAALDASLTHCNPGGKDTNIHCSPGELLSVTFIHIPHFTARSMFSS